jgi:hypothetical protein
MRGKRNSQDLQKRGWTGFTGLTRYNSAGRIKAKAVLKDVIL